MLAFYAIAWAGSIVPAGLLIDIVETMRIDQVILNQLEANALSVQIFICLKKMF